MAAEKFISPHSLLVGRLAGLGEAVRVVHFLRTVQTKPYLKFLFCQKSAPFFINEGAVGLDTVCYATVRGAYACAEVPQSCESTLLPGRSALHHARRI